MINIILCTDNIDLVAEFYSAVGVDLELEKHGNGPSHFSFKTELSCEIYPPRTPPEERIVLRINTPDVEKVLSTLKEKFSYPDLIVSDVAKLKTGQKAIVRDPDGRIVELFQAFDI